MDNLNCSSPELDGDIAGPGVRISFYLQNFILVLLVDRSYTDAPNALWTFIATSFGLTIAALVQVRIGELSLLEGILVSQLSWFANIGTFLALASYSRSKGDDNVVKVAAVLQGYFSMILTVCMWTFADKFPSHAACDFKFVFLFGWELPVLGSGRTVALVFASLTILIYTGVTYAECTKAWKEHHRGSRIRIRGHDVEMAAKTADRDRRGSSGSSRHNRNASIISDSKKKRRPRKRTIWLRTEVDPIFFGIIVSQIIVLTYFISTTERIIKGNDASTGDTFGFGQVLALTVVIPSLISLYRAIRYNRVAKPHDVQKRPEDGHSRAREGLFPTGLHGPRGPSEPRSPPSPYLQLHLSGEDPERQSSGGLAPTAMDRDASLHSISTAT